MSTPVQRSSVDELRRAIDEQQDCQIIDVREVSEYETERIAGVRLTPLSRFDGHAGELDRSKPVYVMCRSGNRAKQAAATLAGLGYTDVRVVDGGMLAWAAAGHPTVRGERKTWSLERQVRFTAGLLVLGGALAGAFVHPGWLLLAGGVGCGLAFSAATDTCAMGMVLARMPWNQGAKSTPPPACQA